MPEAATEAAISAVAAQGPRFFYSASTSVGQYTFCEACVRLWFVERVLFKDDPEGTLYLDALGSLKRNDAPRGPCDHCEEVAHA